MVIHLGLPLLTGSSSLPGSNASHATRFPIWPCCERGLPYPRLLPVGAVRSYRTVSPLPASRERGRRFVFCGTFPGSPPPDVIRRSALCSPDFPRQVVCTPAATIRATPCAHCKNLSKKRTESFFLRSISILFQILPDDPEQKQRSDGAQRVGQHIFLGIPDIALRTEGFNIFFAGYFYRRHKAVQPPQCPAQ